jgi:hypothetical protein
MQRQRQRPVQPGIDAADLTARLFETCGDESLLQVHAVAPADKQLRDGQRLRPGDDVAPAAGVIPRLARQSEALLARRDAVPQVVEAL